MSDPTVDTVINITGIDVPPVIPTAEEIIQAVQATPDQIQTEITNVTTQAVGDLLSGKSPLSSNTLRFNGAIILIGVAGTVYTFWAAGNTAQIVPFLVMVGTGAINSVLRCLTTGPIITSGLAKIMNSLLSINVASVKK